MVRRVHGVIRIVGGTCCVEKDQFTVWRKDSLELVGSVMKPVQRVEHSRGKTRTESFSYGKDWLNHLSGGDEVTSKEIRLRFGSLDRIATPSLNESNMSGGGQPVKREHGALRPPYWGLFLRNPSFVVRGRPQAVTVG